MLTGQFPKGRGKSKVSGKQMATKERTQNKSFKIKNKTETQILGILD